MTVQIALLLMIIVLALILFSLERIPSDVIAIGVLVTLIITGLVPVDRAFEGFGSDAVILIFGLLVLTAALLRTGVVEQFGRAIIRKTGNDHRRLLWVIMSSSSAIGAFMSNTASTAFFIPIVLGISRRAKLNPSKLLLPLAFSSILTSSVTLVSTSTNIVVSGLMAQAGLAPMGMFELSPVGIPIAIVGLVYMYLIGTRMIPERSVSGDNGNGFESRTYLTEVLLLPDSPLQGKTLSESGLGRDLDLTVVRVVRDKVRYLAPKADLRLENGDVLLVEGQRDDILSIKNMTGIDIKADVKLSDPSLQTEDVGLVEAIVMLRSPLIGRTFKGIRFRERFGLQVLAINRHGSTILSKISQVPIRLGDVLLVQGPSANINALDADNTFRVISALEERLPNLRRAPIAVLTFVGVIVLSTLHLVSLPVAVLIGVMIVFLTRCITPEEAYREVEWKALILIGCMLGLGIALDYTGTARFLSMEIVKYLGHANPLWLLSAFFVLTMVLTQPMSNQAAAVVVVPIALQTAIQLGLNPRTFAMMIAVAASCSYLTPLEPSCLMVYGPGNYRFTDFLKVGSLLTLLIFIIAILMVPLIWPLH